MLEGRKRPPEREINRGSILALVFDIEHNPVLTKQSLGLGQAATGEGDVLWEVLGAGDHPRR